VWETSKVGLVRNNLEGTRGKQTLLRDMWGAMNVLLGSTALSGRNSRLGTKRNSKMMIINPMVYGS